MAWFDNATNNVGEIMSRLSNDISSIQGILSATSVLWLSSVGLYAPASRQQLHLHFAGAIGDAFAACLQNVSMVLIGLAIAFSAR